MRMWPFGRKNKRKGSKHVQSDQAPYHASSQHEPGGPLAQTRASSGAAALVTRRPSRRDTKKLQRSSDRRTYSFSPGRDDSINVRALHNDSAHPVPPVPQRYANASRAVTTSVSTADPDFLEKMEYISGQQPLPRHDWQRPPTLSKRSGADLPRRKSSKRRKESHEREAELKAMMDSMPVRAATEWGTAGRPMKRDTRKVKMGLNRHLENPSSDISLPSHASLNSSRVSGSHEDLSASFKLTGMGLLTPHPTIRVSENPRYIPPPTNLNVGPSDSRRRRRISDKMPEEVLRSGKRVDDLADDLDSGDLREILERDQRRRDERKLKEQQRIERRLLRRLEKQKAEEEAAARNGTPPPQVMERGVVGRELAGTPTRSIEEIRNEVEMPAGPETSAPESAQEHIEEQPTSPSPVEDSAAESEPVVETAKVARLSRVGHSPPPSPTLKRKESITAAAPASQPSLSHQPSTSKRRPSDASSRRGNSFTALLRRMSKRKKDTEQVPTPASTVPAFSNTSRDSFAANQLNQQNSAPQGATNPISFMSYTTAGKSNSAMPKRTRSKFREDLPELPISPPDSRVASPETEPIPIPKPFGKRNSITFDATQRYSTPTSGHRSVERIRNETPSSDTRMADPSPEPVLLSQSLASIDSEASWFSGRASTSKRSSSHLHSSVKRESGASFARKFKDFSDSNDEMDIMEDEYMKELAPGTEHRKSIGGALPSSDEDDEGPSGAGKPIWHGSFHKRPRIIHQERIKSRDGLQDFKIESGDENETGSEDAGIQRARSVDLGRGHVRKISAGSARILDMKPRDSVDSRRKSIITMTDD